MQNISRITIFLEVAVNPEDVTGFNSSFLWAVFLLLLRLLRGSRIFILNFCTSAFNANAGFLRKINPLRMFGRPGGALARDRAHALPLERVATSADEAGDYGPENFHCLSVTR